MRMVNDYLPTIICEMICIYILVRLYLTMIKTGRSVLVIMFGIGTAGLFLSGLYWVTFDLLYPLERMPFAANEFAEWAMFLAMASILGSMLTDPLRSAVWEIVFSVFFVAANVGLWIAWSGEWVQDIVTGLALGYFLINGVRMQKQESALTRPVRCLLGLAAVIVIAANIATFFVPETRVHIYDVVVYALMTAVEAYYIIRTIISIYKKEHPKINASLSFLAAVTAFFFMYMSSGIFYNIANISMSASFLLVFMSVNRTVRYADMVL